MAEFGEFQTPQPAEDVTGTEGGTEAGTQGEFGGAGGAGFTGEGGKGKGKGNGVFLNYLTEEQAVEFAELQLQNARDLASSNRKKDAAQSKRDEMTIVSKVQESINRATWPMYSSKSHMSNENFLTQVFEQIHQCASVLETVLADDDDHMYSFNQYKALAVLETPVTTLVNRLVAVAGDLPLAKRRFALTYRSNHMLRVFDRALHSQLISVMGTHHMLNSMVTASDNHHHSAGLEPVDGKSGLILLMTIKQNLRGESAARTKTAIAFVRDIDPVSSNRPVKVSQIKPWMDEMRQAWSMCSTDVSEKELVEETQASISRIFQ